MIAAMATTRRADMFTADGKPSDDDPRENGPRLGDASQEPCAIRSAARLASRPAQ
jgi:hypothetical protein